MLTTVTLNKLECLIGHLHMGDSLIRPRLIWAVSHGKTQFTEENSPHSGIDKKKNLTDREIIKPLF